MSDQGDELVTVLQNLTSGLLWVSEMDAPFEVFHWKGQPADMTDQQLLERTHHDVPIAFRLKPSLRNLNQIIYKFGLSRFLPILHNGLGLDCYIPLQQAETWIRSVL